MDYLNSLPEELINITSLISFKIKFVVLKLSEWGWCGDDDEW